MAIDKKLIHFGKLADFETQLTAGNILDRSIVFIQDAKKIWTHGTYYDCSEGEATGDSLWQEDSEGRAFCDSDIQVDGNIFTNGAVVTGSIGVPSSEGYATGDKGQILRANGDGSIAWDDLSIPTKVSDLENDAEYITHEDVAAVATSGSYNDLTDQPDFIKNVAINGTNITNTNSTVHLPNASTSRYGVTRLNSSISSTSTLEAATSSAVKAAYDLANGKQDKLTSGMNIKTVNGQSILGSGNITIEGGSTDGFVTKETVGELDVANTQALYDGNTVYALPTSACGDEDDILVSERNLKTINGESILGSGNISISGGVSQDYVDNAIANAITTTLNTAV